MTALLESAMALANKLPEDEQNELALFLLAELRSEERWVKSFSGSESLLANLADEALREHRSGQTLPLDPEHL